MEFKQITEFCKHAGPGKLCPENFKHCNADNCPLFMPNYNDGECEHYCPIVDKYRGDARRAKQDYLSVKDELREIYEDNKRSQETLADNLRQQDIIKTELLQIVDKSVDLITSALYDLRDKLKESSKRLEP